MLNTIKAVVRQGKVELLEQVNIPEAQHFFDQFVETIGVSTPPMRDLITMVELSPLRSDENGKLIRLSGYFASLLANPSRKFTIEVIRN